MGKHEYSMEALQFVEECLEKDSRKRITAEAACGHAWLHKRIVDRSLTNFRTWSVNARRSLHDLDAARVQKLQSAQAAVDSESSESDSDDAAADNRVPLPGVVVPSP